MLRQDRDAVKRARAALAPGRRRPSLRARLARSFAEDGIAVAMRYDIELLRQAMRGFHMLEDPQSLAEAAQEPCPRDPLLGARQEAQRGGLSAQGRPRSARR
jgi:hypothetical protein